MESENDKGDRYTIEFTKNELFVIQHCIVYTGCCLVGDAEEAINAFQSVASMIRQINTDDLQKRILVAVGYDVSKIDDAKEGVTYLGDPKAETNIVVNNKETSKIIQ